MNTSHYVFRTPWRLHASVAAVYAALVNVAEYPLWWPQVRSVRQVDERSGELTCRSLLPYDLVFVISREIEDVAQGILRARLRGDLNGTSQWSITTDGARTLAVFDENVVVGSRLLKLAGPVARPALRSNHHLMMNAGERGLRKWLN